MSKKRWNIAVVGATGVVGQQLIECLEEREFPVGTIKFLASSPGEGTSLDFKGKPVALEELGHDSFAGVQIAFFAAGSQLAREFCPSARTAGAVCIDTSSAWRMDPEVPLVVPEVNPAAIAGYSSKGIIATPSGSTIQMLVALKPLHDVGTIKRIVVSTYQAVSATGKMAIDELHQQVVDLLNARTPDSEVYPHRIAFNCLPQVGSFSDNGSTAEELSLIGETRKILGTDLGVSATAVRVPVFYGHSESINIETEKKISAGQARELISQAAGCELVDDPDELLYPLAQDAAGQDLVQVGRIREDHSIANGLNLWVVADNIRKGAATNAVQIAEMLIESHLK